MPASDKYNLDKSKKTILFHTNDCRLKTGFGKQAKNVLKYLYKTNKYNLVEFSNGYVWSDPNIKNKPWLTFGSYPDDPDFYNQIRIDLNSENETIRQNAQARQNAAGYGTEMIDRAIEEFNPDIYFGCEDAWAFNGFTDKKWWKLLNPVLQVTVDSLPILPAAIELAKLTPNFYTWATFAEKELNNLGHKHVKTIPGAIDLDHLFRLPDESIGKLKSAFNLKDNFVIGFIFRNQLRKSIPNLLDGFVKFDAKYPEAKAKLLLHTSLEESNGWDIPRFIKEKNIDNKKVLFTHYCHSCHNYHIRPFNGHGVTCPFCKKANSCRTPNIKAGVSEQQLNEIINLFDVSAQIFNSGGLEVPIYEAKACEKITLVTNYSCGTDGCSPESAGLPLDWSEYREIGTNFIKASTCPISIANQLEKVYKMSPVEKRAMERKARQYVLDNLSAEVVGKKFEQVFDSLPAASYSFKKEKKECNIHFEPDESLDDKEWVESLYDNILNEKDSQGVIQWMQRLKTDASRADVLNYFCRVGASNNQSFFLDKMLKAVNEDNNKKIAFIVPEKEEEIVACTSLLPSIKKQYPDHNIYFFTKPEYFDLISGNPNIYKVLNYTNKMQDPLFFEGKGDSPKYFELAYAPLLGIRNNNYSRNNKDSIQYNIYS